VRAFPADSAAAPAYIGITVEMPPRMVRRADRAKGRAGMRSWTSWIYLAVSVASVVFATLQPPHLAALDQSLVAVARDGWTAPWAAEAGTAKGN
jgi:hypothetical protein